MRGASSASSVSALSATVSRTTAAESFPPRVTALCARSRGPRSRSAAPSSCTRSYSLELELRVGIHTGECERIGNELSGLAVHVAARIGAAAASGETLVSRTVSDLAAGSGLDFASRGIHQLKGVPGDWELLATTGSTSVPSVPAQPPKPRLSDRLIVTAARRAPRVLTALNRLDSARARRSS